MNGVVQTRNGDITCEKVVNACVYRVNEVGAMMGVAHPVVSMEHQYVLTEPLPELEALDGRVPLIRNPLDDFYSRQEKSGLLVGFHEKVCRTRGVDGIDPNFSMQLCADDLDHCMGNMERVFRRLPCLVQTEIHTVINGPITYSADGLPLVGQIPGLIDAYAIIGLRTGLGEGGGHGKLLADLIVNGESEWDTWCLGPRRFGAYANTEHTALKAIEDYQNEFRFHLPHEHRPAARPANTTSLYPLLKSHGAEFAVVNGWERVAFFKPSTVFCENLSFRFNNTHELVGREFESLQRGVGIAEISGFNRYEVSGPAALEWFDSLSCSRLRRAVGELSLAYFLTDKGNVSSEATIANLGNNRFWYDSVAAAEHHDWDWLSARLPEYGVRLERLTHRHTTLLIAGPRSRELLAKVAPRTQWERHAFPWLTVQQVFVGHCTALAMCVSYSGELAFELHVPNEQLYACYETLRLSVEHFDVSSFGLYAVESMRLEKGHRHWKSGLISEFDLFESDLGRFVRLDKDTFPGKSALLERLEKDAPRRKFVSLVLHTDEAPAHPGESLLVGDEVVGSVTSAGRGHSTRKDNSMAFVGPQHAEIGARLDVLMLGRRFAVQLCPACLYDPTNDRIRA
jgi:dimethylglycine dehydrogenase